MQKVRQKRSKVTTTAEMSSGGGFLSVDRILPEGSRRVQRHRNSPKLASDTSSTTSSGTWEEDSFTFELRRRSSKQAFGTPMKKLLSEEISRETESKKTKLGVIARLMGLDGLPSQQSAYKNHKSPSENHSQRKASVEKFHRRKSKEKQEFKDVFEVLETSKMGSSSRFSSQGTAKSKLAEAKMAFIQQKFMDAKRLSTNEKLQNSKEFRDALEVLDSNKDLLLKYLQQPDSLFTKHLYDLQGALPHSNCSRIAAMKLSDDRKNNNHDLWWKSERGTSPKNYSKPPLKHCNGHFSHYDYNYAGRKFANGRLEGKEEEDVLPKRIVLLKPNRGKMQNVTNIVLQPCSSHAFHPDCRKQAEFTNTMNREAEFSGKKKFSNDIGLSRHKSRESREIAKEITRKMRNSFNTGSINDLFSGFKGYNGDESSGNTSDNESSNESEAGTIKSKYSSHLNFLYGPSLTHSRRSSVNREAKRRLSERWKKAHRSLDMEEVCRGSTLAEMLAIPDTEKMPADLNARIGAKRFRDIFPRDDHPTGYIEPLGISSRDGWKDVFIGKLTRSRSLPSSLTAYGSPKRRQVNESLCGDRCAIPKETLKRERKETIEGNREGLVCKNLRSSGKKSPSHCMVREDDDPILEFHTDYNQMKTGIEENYPSEKNLVFGEVATNFKDKSPDPKNAVDVRHENSTATSDDDLPLELFAHKSGKGNICSANQDNISPKDRLDVPSEESSVLQAIPGLESPASSKETDQPSPISILEPPFTDDLSSSSCSDCFESLSADLHGLRMQLQLLKLESETYAERPLASDGNLQEESSGFSDEKSPHKAEASRDLSYIINVLTESGLNNADPNMFIGKWYSPECPIDPEVFEDLEKKHSDQDQNFQSRSERRLLFDRINSGILDIVQRFTNPHPWVRTRTTKVEPLWIKESLQDDLFKWLKTQEKKVNEESIEKMMLRETKWLDLGDEIDIIGKEIDAWLIDELVEELNAVM